MTSNIKIWKANSTFRTGRAYVNVADIYNDLLLAASSIGIPKIDGPIRMTFRRVAQKQLNFVFDLSGGIPEHRGCALFDFSLSVKNNIIHGFVRESSRRIEATSLYDETDLDIAAERDGNTIRINRETTLSPIEVITSLGRRLNDALSPRVSGEKWLIARLELDRPLDESAANKLSISLTKRLSEHLTRATIIANSKPIGKIFFASGRTPTLLP